LPIPGKICVSSDVASRLTAALADWIHGQWASDLQIIAPKAEGHGVKNGYQDPLQLGSDRWSALVAVRNMIEGAAIIVDCGTAITIDVMDANGLHLGGVIMPGIQMLQQSLYQGTHKIELTKGTIEPLRDLLGKNTRDGVSSGLHTAVYAFINEMVDRSTQQIMQKHIQQSKTEKVTCLITGGDADVVLPSLNNTYIHKPTLVLEGLAIILDQIQ